MAGSLTRLISELLDERPKWDLDEFMQALYERCWDRGVICLKWQVELDEKGNFRRFCTDAWEILLRLHRQGKLQIVLRGNRNARNTVLVTHRRMRGIPR